jgi:hypothetical protein
MPPADAGLLLLPLLLLLPPLMLTLLPRLLVLASLAAPLLRR